MKRKVGVKLAFLVAIMTLCSFVGAFAAENSTTVETSPDGVATFAGGCFWCMEPAFDSLEGVHNTVVGYMGGSEASATYKQVSSGKTGHVEAIQISFNPDTITYKSLLEVFWQNIDPTDDEGQFCDRGPQYRSAIFYHSPAQKQAAEKSRESLKDSKRIRGKIVTEIRKAKRFYPAEEKHQNYYTKHPVSYKLYRYRCGRDSRLAELWR